MVDLFPYVFIGFVSVPTNPIHFLTVLLVAMSLTVIDFMLDNLVDDIFFRFVFLLFFNVAFSVLTLTGRRFCFFSFEHGFGARTTRQRDTVLTYQSFFSLVIVLSAA